MRKSFFVLTIGLLGVVMVFGGCAKKAKPDASSGVEEERMVSSSEIGEDVSGSEKPGMTESELSPGGTGQEEGVSAGGLTTIHFDFDKFNIREEMRPVMKGNSDWLKSHPDVKVSIEGHADERGTNEYNLALGERRAQATKRYLASLGVDKGRLSTISYGEERPSCSKKLESCYSKNRRAQFKLR